MRTQSFKLKKDEYNYLLPAVKKRLFYSHPDRYYLMADSMDDLEDSLNRLQGLYDSFDEGLPDTVITSCYINGNLDAFRSHMRTKKFPKRH